MFSFHKPRIYRSQSGCCICRAKSSSSRFTDSRRYEDDFFECFKLDERRSGEVCNACVLLVKRWKKLPQGSQRNWQHVVDARAGHGSKPLSKINKVKKKKVKVEEVEIDVHLKKEVLFPQMNRTRDPSPSGLSDDVQLECLSSESGSYHSSLAASPIPSPGEVGEEENQKEVQKGRKKGRRGRSKSRNPEKCRSNMNSFLDLNFWKREKTCCGVIFKGPCGEVLIDKRIINPCFCRPPAPSTLPPLKIEKRLEIFSLDSGYDDSSNSTIPISEEPFRLVTARPEKKPNLIVGSFISTFTVESTI